MGESITSMANRAIKRTLSVDSSYEFEDTPRAKQKPSMSYDSSVSSYSGSSSVHLLDESMFDVVGMAPFYWLSACGMRTACAA